MKTIYLHGFSGEGKSLKPFAELYSGEDSICLNMPGFGGTAAPDGKGNHDIFSYSEHVWDEIRRQVPDGTIRLVGHSHGSMIGFALGLQHPDEIESLDLFCPVASPRMAPRLTSIFLTGLLKIGIQPKRVVRLISRRWFVDTVTWYSLRKDWSPEVRRRIIDMRRGEAQYYSPIIFDFIAQTGKFQKLMNGRHLIVPTKICYVADENIAGKHDYEWYEKHANVTRIQCLKGGHLCVVAEPKRVVKEFGKLE